MIHRSGYVGAVGLLLLTLACGPKVEIGHGTTAGAGGSLAGGAKAGQGGASDGEGGESAAGTLSGGGTSTNGGSSSGASRHVGGPMPPDSGPQREVTKVDLLLALDNSMSMAEKQTLFAKTIPELVKRLVNPPCVDAAGAVTAEPTAPELPCPAGSARELEPLRDLHVGVITSSLGSHGAKGAKDVCTAPEDNDNAHLLGTVRPGVKSYDGHGYLKWDPDGTSSPPGEADVQAFADSLAQMIESAGETGCGYEAQLESVYRFLVDPAPPLEIVIADGSSVAYRQGIDTTVLEQRANFLRPDSSVAVVILTDENDCSIIDDGYGWLVARAAPLYRSTSVCLADPNDACCQSCGEATANAGCPSIAEDVECQKGINLSAQGGEDDLNLRCWHQKQRFGFSLLYPLERYVNGFGGGTVRSRNDELVANPLFHRDGVDRDPSLFTLAVVGGVPWQDIATPASLTGDTLKYLTAAELTAQKRWSVIVGDPERYVEPTDAFMRESAEPRTGKNPITGESIVAPSSTDPTANSINGHEQVNLLSRDLQYACIFPLPEPIECDMARFDNDQGCDCFAEDLSFNRPVCQPPGGGAPATTQYYAKAYPALRELAVASELGRRAVLGSVCARNTQDEARSDFGYRPVFEALGRRIASTLVKP